MRLRPQSQPSMLPLPPRPLLPLPTPPRLRQPPLPHLLLSMALPETRPRRTPKEK
jgi:hypothetical protein